MTEETVYFGKIAFSEYPEEKTAIENTGRFYRGDSGRYSKEYGNRVKKT